MSIRVSTVICTLNRREMLKASILSLTEQTVNREQHEIIVVDNGSNDSTRDAVDELTKRIPNLRYVFEARPGLSNARNLASDLARGEVVAFIDDDAVAEERWLEALLLGYRSEPDVSAVGGRIHLRWPSGRPRGLPQELEPHFGKLDLGENRQIVQFLSFRSEPICLS